MTSHVHHRLRSFILLALLGAGCATSTELPAIDGESFAPGMYTFQTQRDAVVEDAELAPWSTTWFYPVLEGPNVERREPTMTKLREQARGHTTASSPTLAAAWLYYRFYKETFSRVDGNTCRFNPSCSTFGIQAVRDHGLFGIASTFGRLHRNHSAEEFYPTKIQPYLEDPVANYTFVFREPKLDDFSSYDDEAHAWVQHLRAVRRLKTPEP